MARFRKNDFFKWAQKIKSVFCFNPYTHEGCDWADARISDMVKEFQSTHTKGVTLIFMHDEDIVHVSIHTPTKGVTQKGFINTFCVLVSIHTPTKGVTYVLGIIVGRNWFQSTHPRRV